MGFRATRHPGPRDAKTQEVGSLLAWKGLPSTTSAPGARASWFTQQGLTQPRALGRLGRVRSPRPLFKPRLDKLKPARITRAEESWASVREGSRLASLPSSPEPSLPPRSFRLCFLSQNEQLLQTVWTSLEGQDLAQVSC